MTQPHRRRVRKAARGAMIGGIGLAAALAGMPFVASAANAASGATPGSHGQRTQHTATPIQHLVVLFQENVSFDHYYGTYPYAANPKGQTRFTPARHTPRVNGLTNSLLTANPNGANPTRLGPDMALTCDQDHGYAAEQKAFDHGAMDLFQQNTQTESCNAPDKSAPHLVMDYYDGNTVTAMWNYAQHFALSDNSYNTTFGPSTPGALNLVSGQTHGVFSVDPLTGQKTPTPDPYTVASPDSNGIGTVINDPDPAYDDCQSTKYPVAAMTGKNIGDLLNAKGVSWGWFQGGFRPTTASSNGSRAVCGATHTNIGGATVNDYSAHHDPFEYYKSTANPHHAAPASINEIGHAGPANHQYDLSDFYAALKANKLPSVSFLKAAAYQDGHAGYSDPLDEQHYLTTVINALQKSPEWKSTAVVISYDDSDGWYDHQMSPILNSSHDAANDFVTSDGNCGTQAPQGGYADRCGYGPRLPLLVISPYSKTNYVDHSITDQSSILRFVEDNWLSGQRIGDASFDALAGTLNGMFDFRHPNQRKLILDPTTGQPTK